MSILCLEIQDSIKHPNNQGTIEGLAVQISKYVIQPGVILLRVDYFQSKQNLLGVKMPLNCRWRKSYRIQMNDQDWFPGANPANTDLNAFAYKRLSEAILRVRLGESIVDEVKLIKS